MKKVMLALSMMLLGMCATAQQRSLQNLIGTWQAVRADSEGAGLRVVDSTELYLVYGSQQKKITACKADFTVSPVRFDFSVKDSTETLRLRSLIEFVNQDLIKWQLFEGEVQPVHFVHDGAEVVYLRRKK